LEAQDTGDAKECLREIAHPERCELLTEHLIISALEKKEPQRNLMYKLIKFLAEKKEITAAQYYSGLNRIFMRCSEDLLVDFPKAHAIIAEFIARGIDYEVLEFSQLIDSACSLQQLKSNNCAAKTLVTALSKYSEIKSLDSVKELIESSSFNVRNFMKDGSTDEDIRKLDSSNLTEVLDLLLAKA